MTQAFNLSQLANNLNSAGQLDASDGLVNAVPLENGGTGANTQSAAQENLDVPARDGSGASGTWDIDISGNAATASNGGVISVNGDTGAVSVPSVGVDQTWQDVKASRAVDTTYTNTTGKPICVAVMANGIAISNYSVQINVDSGIIFRNAVYQPSGGSVMCFVNAIVPNGSTYVVSITGNSPTINHWNELR